MIVVGGENLIDLVQSRGAAPGETRVDVARADVATFQAIPGGSQYNVALALGRLGSAVSYLTPISNDALGHILADTLARSGVELASPRVDAPSSLAVVTLSGDGQPSYQFYRENTAERQVTAQGLAAGLPDTCTAFQVGSLALCDGDDADAWADLFCTLAARGVLCTLDPNARPSFVTDQAAYMARLERVMAAASVIKLSDEDVGWLYPRQEPLAVCRKLVGQGRARLVALTQGAQGAVMISGQAEVAVPAAPLSPERLVDTVGAGDTFMAGLIHQLSATAHGEALDKPALADIGGFAAAAAAITCTRSGCNPPTGAEVRDWLAT